MKNNIGLITTSIIFLLAIFSYLIYRNLTRHLIAINLKGIQYIDALSYDPDKYSKEQFFLRNPINAESLHNYEKKKMIKNLIDNCNQDNISYLFNKDDNEYIKGIK